MAKTPKEICICQYCGKQFKGRHNQKFCSHSCAVMSSRRNIEQKNSVGNAQYKRYRQDIAPDSAPQVAKVQEIAQKAPQNENMQVYRPATLKEALLYLGMLVGVQMIFNPPQRKKRKRT